MADATAELGMFELSFLVRAVAQGGAKLDENVQKLALFVSSIAEADISAEFVKHIGNEAPELGQLLELFGKLER